MLMKHSEHGWQNASSLEAEEMKKNGWAESSYEELANVIAAKNAPKIEEAAIIEPQQEAVKRKPGRKPKIAQE